MKEGCSVRSGTKQHVVLAAGYLEIRLCITCFFRVPFGLPGSGFLIPKQKWASCELLLEALFRSFPEVLLGSPSWRLFLIHFPGSCLHPLRGSAWRLCLGTPVERPWGSLHLIRSALWTLWKGHVGTACILAWGMEFGDFRGVPNLLIRHKLEPLNHSSKDWGGLTRKLWQIHTHRSGLQGIRTLALLGSTSRSLADSPLAIIL